jgi:shikimate dehydrogenase
MTDRYVVIGNPIGHSKSPAIHALFARETGQDMHYERLLAPLDGFRATVQSFRDAGGRGCNVTVPFKFEAFELAHACSERAQLAQAANTLRFEADGRIVADNTDGPGLVRDITLHAGVPIAGRSVLLLGAGGAASGALASLLQAQPGKLVVCNRSMGKARELVERHAPLAQALGIELLAQSREELPHGFDMVINSTSSSLAGEALPMDPHVVRRGTLVYDMMYGPSSEPALQWARQHGAIARDGFGMLVEQAAEAFFIWRGVRPDTRALMPLLRKELVG